MDLTKHSPFPWYLHHEAMVIMSGEGRKAQAVAYASQSDIEIILSAVNNTYGKGVNPETERICRNCRHFNPSSTVEKTFGKCENEKNEVRVIGLNMINSYISDEEGRKEIKDHFDDSIRYPEDFGCIFFEPII